MVEEVRRGLSLREAAGAFGRSHSTVLFWLRRAEGRRLDRVEWEDRSSAPQQPRRTPIEVEDLVLLLRRDLKERSDLGEFGALAIQEELRRRHAPLVPSIRTIGRILERRGALDLGRRVRRPAPPIGWYLPEVAARRVELDSFDTVEGLVIRGGIHLEVLTGISLHGAIVSAWPMPAVIAPGIMQALIERWREVGLPAYAQFDNDTRFHGTHASPDMFGRVPRFCLSLGVRPVFAPPREHGFQAAIENFNGRWQAKVWARFQHPSLEALCERSIRYVAAARQQAAVRREAAPERRAFPQNWKLDLHAPLRTQVVFLRRTTEQGCVQMLGHTFDVDRTWLHRLVRAEVDFDLGAIRFYALRRRDPTSQPLLRELPYRPHAKEPRPVVGRY